MLSAASFLQAPEPTAAGERLFADDLEKHVNDALGARPDQKLLGRAFGGAPD